MFLKIFPSKTVIIYYRLFSLKNVLFIGTRSIRLKFLGENQYNYINIVK